MLLLPELCLKEGGIKWKMKRYFLGREFYLNYIFGMSRKLKVFFQVTLKGKNIKPPQDKRTLMGEISKREGQKNLFDFIPSLFFLKGFINEMREMNV